MKEFLLVFVGLCIANFAWQYLCAMEDYAKAAERSFFQGLALLVAWLAVGAP